MRFSLPIYIAAFAFLLFPVQAQASNLATAQVRLDRQAANSPLAGLVCATPTSIATEGKVQITFPSDFSLSSSGWSTSTANIPSSTTSWPGISFQSASGATAVFSSNDLTPSTKYCFTFTASGSTTGNTGTKTGTITTLTGGSATIDSQTYGLTIGNDQITLSGTVPAQISDYTANLEKVSPFGTIIRPETKAEYKLTYTSNLSYVSDIQVVASWSQGTIGSASTPSTDIVDYVVGSASTGYNSSAPVIDTANRTITWTIPSYPGGESKYVLFQLKTVNSFRGAENVAFTVSGKILGPSVESLSSSVTSYYSIAAPLDIPPTTPAPTAAPVNPTATPSSPKKIEFEQIQIPSISSDKAVIQASFTNDAIATIQYGASISSLNKSLVSLISKNTHEFTLSELQPNTTYYFRITGKSGAQIIYSDYFTFKTAKKTAIDKLDLASSLILESNSIVLLDPFRAKETSPVAIVPINSSFQLRFRTDPEAGIKKIQLFLKNKNVLGFSTFGKEDTSGLNVNMIEVKKGEFTGRLFSGNTAGVYNLIARVQDSQGNITEKKLADVRVLPFMKVVTQDNKPIENARAFLSYFSESEKRFLDLSNQGLSIPNPYYSDINGEFKMTLPEGQYRAHISSIGFKGQDVDFVIGSAEKDIYPTVVLKEEPFSIFNVISYYYSTISDLIKTFTEDILPLSRSSRVVDLAGISTLSILILLSFAAFFRKTRFDLYSFGFFTLHHTPLISSNKKLAVLTGKVIDQETQKPIPAAVVTILDEKNRVLQTTKTNTKGIFYCAYSPNQKIISVVEKGYLEREQELTLGTKESILVKISKEKGRISSYEKKLLGIPGLIFSVFFEGILILSCVTQLYFFFLWGPYKILPFFALSIINIILFAYFQNSHKRFNS